MKTMTASDRGMAMSMMNLPGMGMNMNMPMGAMAAPMPTMMVPRCTIAMEKMSEGMKITCTCEDKTAAAMLQNLCTMLANGMCGCCMMMNGMMVCQCNMPMAMCQMTMTDMGCTMTCTSGDQTARKMMQACCDCLNAMMMPGCTCFVMLNNMPVCCMAC